eukprot:TRINITY_DN15626_c0_g1_i1.p1 TRINITY_DN15626_c0_g1~~TRINITY_DN15626_c0_g1_i1.p1  ORF type:complete len:551 (+),score=31.78 TRINITY_DN15626_c0_g1_i1:40-1692(+)
MQNQQKNVLVRGVAGIRYLLALQFFSRGFTFVLNVLITRFLDPKLLGLAHVQLQLLLNLILFLSRESFRRVCLRQSLNTSSGDEKTRNINLSWMTVPLGLVISVCTCIFFLRFSSDEQLAIKDYGSTVLLTGLGSFLEILSEPAYIVIQNHMLFRVRVAIEASAILLRCVSTYILVVNLGLGLISFGYAQVIFGFSLIVGYFGYVFWRRDFGSIRDAFPKYLGSQRGRISPATLGLLINFTWQSIQKLILQEGEKFILWGVASLLNMGIYSIVNNLGSLAARFLFQPIEEVSFNVFTKLISEVNEDTRDPSEKSNSLDQISQVLNLTLKFVTYVGLYFVAFGPGYSFLLLHLLYTEKYSYSAAPAVLSWYCLYVLFMALNGITEAFVHAVASKKDLTHFNILMIFFSCVYIVASYVLIGWMETSGLVIANCINMGLRIFFSVGYMRDFFWVVTTKLSRLGEKIKPSRVITISKTSPHPYVLILFFLSFAVTSISSNRLCCNTFPVSFTGCTIHLLIGAISFVLTSFAVFFMDRDFLRDLIRLWRQEGRTE